MRKLIVFEDGEHVCDSGSVVRAESGALCVEPALVVYVELQGIFFEVMDRSLVGFADHVHMSLDEQRRAVFIAFGRILVYDYVVEFVPDVS